jgi:hypothetical protein
MVVQRVGGKGGQQAFAAAFEQADIEVLFELANLLRQAGWDIDRRSAARPT